MYKITVRTMITMIVILVIIMYLSPLGRMIFWLPILTRIGSTAGLDSPARDANERLVPGMKRKLKYRGQSLEEVPYNGAYLSI